MRAISFLVVGAVVAAAGCSRPVLYYPPTPARAAAPARAHPAPPPPPTPAANAAPSAMPTLMITTASADIDYLMSRRIIVPVAGADMAKVEDSFNEGRDGGERTHRAIDILAPRGTPILSADGGRILRMSTSTLGGICMYTVDSQNRLVYYYAHMDHYNEAMTPGREIVKGDTLGFVGTTGNAPKDTPHLHFQVMRWPADGRYWNGDPIDPFEALGGQTRSERLRHSSGRLDDF
jgi:murein DD-endopeptidase MepM/ murein hydrolase activator NlpD